MKRILKKLCCFLLAASAAASLCGCGGKSAAEPMKLRVLIVPKFEIGEMSGDYPGEAQLFYEKYFPDAEKTVLPNLPSGADFYVNEDSGAALLVTGSGKTAAALALSAAFSCSAYDYSECCIVSVGCAGGSVGYTTLGDVVAVTAACDNELGHTADIREFEDTGAEVTWFHDASYDDFSCKEFSPALAAWAMELAKDAPLQTTEISRKLLEKNFPGEAWAAREPVVLYGTALSGDSYWKGEYGHKNALAVTGYYGCTDPYAVTEMEELTVANTAESFGLLENVVSLRVVVDIDVFWDGDSPENLWGEGADYNNTVEDKDSEELDIFETAMYNLLETASPVIDAALAGNMPRKG